MESSTYHNGKFSIIRNQLNDSPSKKTHKYSQQLDWWQKIHNIYVTRNDCTQRLESMTVCLKRWSPQHDDPNNEAIVPRLIFTIGFSRRGKMGVRTRSNRYDFFFNVVYYYYSWIIANCCCVFRVDFPMSIVYKSSDGSFDRVWGIDGVS